MKLIITADDFGAAPEVNEAVERAYRNGVLTAASLMVGAPAAADAIERAKSMPKLGVGLHIVLAEGWPVLPASAVPALVDARGRFHSHMIWPSVKMFCVPEARRQVAAEIEAQFDAFAASGLRLDHVNAHKHFHLHPTIAGLILEIGRRYGMTAVRVPREPLAVLRRTEPPGAGGGIPRMWAKRLGRRVAAAGIRSPDHVFGLCWSGAMTAERLSGLLVNLPDGVSEIYLHPAVEPYPGCVPGYRYADELAALTSTQVINMIRKNGIRLGTFTDLLQGEGPLQAAPAPSPGSSA
jgi:hopanoid biosynthesis associated protein HpnK